MIGFQFVVLQFCIIVVFSFIGLAKMTTAEDAPEVVNSLGAYYDESSNSIFVNWTKPLETNEMLRGYSVKLVHQKWQHFSFVPVPQVAFNVSSEVNSVVFNTTQIKFSSVYEVYVTPITDKKEPEMMTIISTPESSPDEVRLLTAIFNEASKTIIVNWLKPLETNGMLRGYNVRLVHLRWRHFCLVPVPEIDFNVSSEVNRVVFNTMQFKFSSSYGVYVAAITVEKGPAMLEIIYTPESIPEAAPKNLSISSITSTSCDLKWLKPDCQYSNGRITTFDIRGQGIQDVKEHSITNIGFIELAPNSKKDVTIAACTAVGCGKVTAKITFRTLTSRPRPIPPRDSTVYSVTINSLSITWLFSISSTSNVTKYKIMYIKQKGAKSSVILYDIKEVHELECKNSKLRRNRLCHSLTSLEARTDYDIWVVAIDDKGEQSKQKDAHVIGRTEELKPEAPGKLELENSTTTSLFVSWMEPVRANGRLIEYRINVKLIKTRGLGLGNGSVVYSFVQHNPDVTNHNITGLEPANTYDVMVEAATSAGYGPAVHKLFYTRNSVPNVTVPEVSKLFTIQLLIKKSTDHYKEPICTYFVLVKDVTNKRVKREALELRTYNQSKTEYVAAKFYSWDFSLLDVVNFTMGDGKYYQEFYNAPLETGHEYIFGTAVLSRYKGEEKLGYKYMDEAVYVTEKLWKVETGNYSVTSEPEAPTKLELENRTTTSLFISWMEPVKTNGELIEYRINVTSIDLYPLRPMDGQIVYSIVEDNPNITVHNITELKPGSTYNVTVEAATSAGYGPPVHKLFYTRNSVPKLNLRPEVSKITKDRVQLLIKPIDNEPISAYLVLVKDVTHKRVKPEALELRTYNQSKTEYVAAKFNASEMHKEGINFTVGDGEFYEEFYNAPLENGHEYIFGTAVLREVDGEQQIIFAYLEEPVYVTESLPMMTPQTGFINSTIILTVILVFVVFFNILYYKKPELFRRACTNGTSTNNKIGSVEEKVCFTKPPMTEMNLYEEYNRKSVDLMNLNDPCSTDSVIKKQPDLDSPIYDNCLDQSKHLA